MNNSLCQAIIYCLLINFFQCQACKAGDLTVASLELSKIIDQQNFVFSKAGIWSEDEFKQQAQGIVNLYESFLVENPNEVYALILYGKFLKKTGHDHEAADLFFRADKINPDIAVVKQGIGNFLAENNKYTAAFPFFLKATQLSDEEPEYHYNLGSFLYFSKDKIRLPENEQDLDELMHESFRKAANLEPNNFEYQLRFAQSFFDYKQSDKTDGLLQWEKLLKSFGDRSLTEVDYLKIGKARMLIDLEQDKEAKLLLEAIKTNSLQISKETLLNKLEEDLNK